jgi:pilus assembly protein CpaB
MNARTIILILLAVVTAAFTAFYARNWLNAQRAAILASARQSTTVVQAPAKMVLVAAKTLPAGTFIKDDNLKWQPWPEDGVMDGYAVKGQREAKDFVGAVVRSVITAGEPLTDARLVHPGDRGFLAAVLDPGKRAVSVPVNATSGIAGFVFPGDWVDVLMTMRIRVDGDGEKSRSETRYFSETLLTDVRVLAIDQAVENKKGEPAVAKTATLEVDPKQAEKVAIGLEMGSLSLSLHSLAREQDPFSAIARSVGADPVETAEAQSYTMDNDVYYMLDDLLAARGKKKAKKQVNVLRGSEAAAATF